MYRINSCNIDSRNVTLTISKVSNVTGEGLSGAVFELEGLGNAICRGTTNSGGFLRFRLMPCNTYVLREITPPAGYQPNNTVYQISVDGCGCIYVNGNRTSNIVIENIALTAAFTAIKTNIVTGEPLSGALFSLYNNNVLVGNTLSTETGAVTFEHLAPGLYELSETIPPVGFQPNVNRLPVMVAADGSVTIMGQPANGFRLVNVPLTLLVFQKTSAATGQPLAGAVFQLSNGATVISTATSGADGNVNFGPIPMGTYQLRELGALPGYLPNATVYQVVISTGGAITVNGMPLDAFRVENVPA